ncbi:MAG: hypothetical protein ABIH34_08215 [Nanoarchaeota archaeon]
MKRYDAALPLLLVTVGIIISIPLVVRSLVQEGLLIGPEPYEMMIRAAEPATGYDFILWSARALFGAQVLVFVVQLLPPVFMIASLALGYHILRKSGKSQGFSLYALILFVSSSAVLSASLRFGEQAFLLFLSMLSGYLFIKSRLWYIGAGLLCVVTLTSPAFGLMLGMTFLFFSARRVGRAMVISIPSIIIALNSSRISPEPATLHILSDFGSLTGVSIFTLVAAIGGIVLCWRTRRTNAPLYLFFFLSLLGFRLWASQTMLLPAMSTSILGAFTIEKLLIMKWRLPLIKQLTLTTIGCGLLFSTLITLDSLTVSEPNPAVVQSWLALSRYPDGRVLTHERYWPYIQTFAQKEPVMREPMKQSYELFYTNDFAIASDLLRELNVSYLWIDEAMKHDLIWDEPEQGLLFLLRNNETFTNIYSRPDIETWKVSALPDPDQIADG